MDFHVVQCCTTHQMSIQNKPKIRPLKWIWISKLKKLLLTNTSWNTKQQMNGIKNTVTSFYYLARKHAPSLRTFSTDIQMQIKIENKTLLPQQTWSYLSTFSLLESKPVKKRNTRETHEADHFTSCVFLNKIDLSMPQLSIIHWLSSWVNRTAVIADEWSSRVWIRP